MPSRMHRARRSQRVRLQESVRGENRVQNLYDACRRARARHRGINSSASSPRSLQQIRTVLDSIQPEDVGLLEESLSSANEDHPGSSETVNNNPSDLPPPTISYCGIHDCKEFSIGIFCLSRLAVIPLHDHPGMTVINKLLYGSMHVKAYDWIEPPSSNADPSQPRMARLVRDEVLSAPCDISILYPTSGGNIHTFAAITPCALLDVFIPPYSIEEGRDCTYYRDTPVDVPGSEEENNDSQARRALLDVLAVDLALNLMAYKGQRIRTH